MYLTDGSQVSDPQPLAPEDMAYNLIQLNIHIQDQENELSSLEHIIAEMFMNNIIFNTYKVDVLECIWNTIQTESIRRLLAYNTTSTAAAATNSTAEVASVYAGGSLLSASFRTIAMIAKLSPEAMCNDKIDMLGQLGLADYLFQEKDFGTLRSVCICLQMCIPYITLDSAVSSTSTGTNKSSVAAAAAVVAVEKQRRMLLVSLTPALRRVLVGDFLGQEDEGNTR